MAGISCCWCPECWEHLACVLTDNNGELSEEEADRLADRIAAHNEICPKAERISE